MEDLKGVVERLADRIDDHLHESIQLRKLQLEQYEFVQKQINMLTKMLYTLYGFSLVATVGLMLLLLHLHIGEFHA